MDRNEIFNEGLNLGRNGDHERALACFMRVLDAEPQHVMARYNAGVCLLRLARYRESAHIFRELLPDCPGDADIYVNMGKIMERTNNPENARACFDKALQIDPMHAEAICRLGLLHGKYFGDTQTAMKLLKKAVEINDRIAEAHQGLGICYHHLGDYDLAIEHLRQAVRVDSGNAAVHNHLGIMYLKVGAEDKADEHFRQALSINPDTKLRHENLWQMEE